MTNSISQKPELTIEAEEVKCCPLCNSNFTKPEISDVEDWAFGNVSGRWNFYKCVDCASVYINPRPLKDVIWRAYEKYYTHEDTVGSKRWGKDDAYIEIIINLLYTFVKKLTFNKNSFLNDLSVSPPGIMLDIGCGNGRLMIEAKKTGWCAVGIEFDEAAVNYCKKIGLSVTKGEYGDLANSNQTYKLIICSHVLEHVFNPLELIAISIGRLDIGGEFWLQWPNPKSDGLKKYGKHWRGLEAPRHITLPSIEAIKRYIFSIGEGSFTIEDKSQKWKRSAIFMNMESKRIMRKSRKINPANGPVSHLWEFIIYCLSSTRIREPEVCTLLIRRNK